MSGTYPIVRQLLNTGSDTAIGIGYVLQALLQAATKPGGKTPIIVQHTDRQGTIRVMMFSRQTLSITFSNVILLFKREFGLVPVTVTGALFYNEDGTVQTTPVEMSEESWPDLMAHVHKIFIRASR